MFQAVCCVRIKKDCHFKDMYEQLSDLIKVFSLHNQKGLKAQHYQNSFSYYGFSQLEPKEKDAIYKVDHLYNFSIRSLTEELMDLKAYRGLETASLRVEDVHVSPIFYQSSGSIRTETPAYLGEGIKTLSSEKLEEKIRENMVFRYLKSGRNHYDDIDAARFKSIKSITISPFIASVPFHKKKMKNGQPFRYHLYHVNVLFFDTPMAKEMEKVIYAGGVGKNTANGFGFIQ